MGLSVIADNYRGLRRTAWAPKGVCALAGPNGSGKSTLLALPSFLRNVFTRTLAEAVGFLGGNFGLRHLAAPPEEPVRLSASVGDLIWRLDLAVRGASVDEAPGESLRVNGEVVLHRQPFANSFTFQGVTFATDDRTCLRVAYDATRDQLFEPLVKALSSARYYDSYHLHAITGQGSQAGSDTFLHPSGRNVFTVLRNWRDRRDSRPKYEFVLDALRLAYPDVFTELEFQTSGLTTSAGYYHPSFPEALPIHTAPSGLVVGLLHLCAVAGAARGGFVAIDEMENSLHPAAIRVLIDAFRDLGAENDLTIVLATHSPVVLDCFERDPDQLYLMQPGRGMRSRPA